MKTVLSAIAYVLKKIRDVFFLLIKPIVNILFCLVLFCFLCMGYTYVKADCDRTQANVFGYSPFLVMSESMEPTILTGELILTKQIKFDDVEVGDIIVYKHTYANEKSIAIVHRVIEKTDYYLIMKGDNNEAEDPWKVYPSDVRAEVIYY
jgi:signal peptidase